MLSQHFYLLLSDPDLPEDDERLRVGGQGAPLRPLPLPHHVVEVVILQEISQDLNLKERVLKSVKFNCRCYLSGTQSADWPWQAASGRKYNWMNGR